MKSLSDIIKILSDHTRGEIDKDVSIVASVKDSIHIVYDIADLYDESYSSINTSTDYVVISSISSNDGDERILFVEDIRNADGELKVHESDILIIPSYLPQDIKEHLLSCESLEYIHITLN